MPAIMAHTFLWYKQVKVIGFFGRICPREEEADISNENVFTVFEPNIDEYKTNRPQHHQQHQHTIHHATAIPGACQFKSKASRSSKDWKDWVIFESFFSWRTCSLGLHSHPCWGAMQNWCMYSKGHVQWSYSQGLTATHRVTVITAAELSNERLKR